MNNFVKSSIVPETPASAPEGIVLAKAAGIAWITLDRPSSGNSINLGLAHALSRAMQDCEGDPDVRCIVIRGRGRLFCSGGDLLSIREQGANASAYVRELLGHLHEALSGIARIKVPVVAAVNGTAAGAGLSLACACDVVVAHEAARFVMAYTRVGLTPDGSSTFFLPRIVGLQRALELALTNRELSAEEARNWGIVTEVVHDKSFDARIEALATTLARGATSALGQAKRLLRGSFHQTLESQMVAEAEALCAALDGDEAKTGLDAFVSKRSPNFKK
jgi:2-(1,2-epoxy-1,2-dihydrophenyl)acetyl-CoA isomerase